MAGRLTRAQIEALRHRIAPMLSFFWQCKRRLQALGYNENDKMFKAVVDAHAALHALNFELWESGPYSTRKRDEELPPAGDRTF
jgi:hypothetical protein